MVCDPKGIPVPSIVLSIYWGEISVCDTPLHMSLPTLLFQWVCLLTWVINVIIMVNKATQNLWMGICPSPPRIGWRLPSANEKTGQHTKEAKGSPSSSHRGTYTHVCQRPWDSQWRVLWQSIVKKTLVFPAPLRVVITWSKWLLSLSLDLGCHAFVNLPTSGIYLPSWICSIWLHLAQRLEHGWDIDSEPWLQEFLYASTCCLGMLML